MITLRPVPLRGRAGRIAAAAATAKGTVTLWREWAGQREVSPLGTPGPWTHQRAPSGFAICLIAKALFLLRRAFAHSERSHHSVLAVERHRVGEAPPCDRESIGVALICLRNQGAVVAPAVCSW
jgi:hypothetical protein